MGSANFTIQDDATCGSVCPIEFVDGLNGTGNVPVNNVVSVANSSRAVSCLDCAIEVVEKERFVRGDCNFSQIRGGMAVDIADAAAVMSFVYGRGIHTFEPPCLDACDCNDDNLIDAADALCILQYYFEGGAFPVTPGPGLVVVDDLVQETAPGQDPTRDFLDCRAGTLCDGESFRGGGGLREICDNGVDDDGDGLSDLDDPKCQHAFACGARTLDPSGVSHSSRRSSRRNGARVLLRSHGRRQPARLGAIRPHSGLLDGFDLRLRSRGGRQLECGGDDPRGARRRLLQCGSGQRYD